MRVDFDSELSLWKLNDLDIRSADNDDQHKTKVLSCQNDRVNSWAIWRMAGEVEKSGRAIIVTL